MPIWTNLPPNRNVRPGQRHASPLSCQHGDLRHARQQIVTYGLYGGIV
jgi:hypothetical protein